MYRLVKLKKLTNNKIGRASKFCKQVTILRQNSTPKYNIKQTQPGTFIVFTINK